jgi:hypothetical protein
MINNDNFMNLIKIILFILHVVIFFINATAILWINCLPKKHQRKAYLIYTLVLIGLLIQWHFFDGCFLTHWVCGDSIECTFSPFSQTFDELVISGAIVYAIIRLYTL